ncbi:MAG: glycosyltransferase family 39 protein [Candidatus Levybacteria bacterium]|nr:glycosyltransferase family 39 protein [Candidatus Levybacteria bacterium]
MKTKTFLKNNREKIFSKKTLKIIEYLIITLIIFLSVFPRAAEVLSGNYLFGFDQGRDYLAVKNIVVDKKLTLIGSEIGAGSAGFQGVFHGPLHYFFLATFFAVLNGNPYGGVLLTFLYGAITIFLGYLLGKKLLGRWAGIVTSLLIAISPPLISYSRFVWNTHGSTIFILLSFYFLLKSLEEKQIKLRNLFLTSFFAGFSYNFQLAVATPLSLTVILFYIFIIRKERIIKFITLFSGFILAFAPMIFFEIRHGFTTINGIYTYIFIREKNIVTAKFIELNLKDHFGLFIYNFLDTFQRVFPVQNTFFLILFFLVFIYFFLREPRGKLKNFLFFIILLPIISFFILSFIKGAIYVYYLTHLYFVYILFFVYILYSSFKYKLKIVQLVGIVLTIVMVINASIKGSVTFFYDYKDYGGTAKIKGKIDALDFIYQDSKGKPFNLLVFSPPVYTYPYDYVIWWYGQRKYNYVPSKEKKDTFYLWIEVDSSKPWSYKGWMETVIKSGKIEWTQTLPSGFIIQKRIEDEKI